MNFALGSANEVASVAPAISHPPFSDYMSQWTGVHTVKANYGLVLVLGALIFSDMTSGIFDNFLTFQYNKMNYIKMIQSCRGTWGAYETGFVIAHGSLY